MRSGRGMLARIKRRPVLICDRNLDGTSVNWKFEVGIAALMKTRHWALPGMPSILK